MALDFTFFIRGKAGDVIYVKFTKSADKRLTKVDKRCSGGKVG